jgi:hypothetical protein
LNQRLSLPLQGGILGFRGVELIHFLLNALNRGLLCLRNRLENSPINMVINVIPLILKAFLNLEERVLMNVFPL